MKRNNHPGKMIRILLICLCAVLAMGCACAEKTEGVNLSTDRRYALNYGTTLSDGRILLVGSREVPGEDAGSAWLLCLNPDRTVSWEYTDDAKDDGHFTCAAELEDGTIGLAFCKIAAEPDSAYTLRFFTTDGKPTGKEVNIPRRKDAVTIQNATKSRLQMICMTFSTKTGENQYQIVRHDNYLIDWDGNEIAFLEDFDLWPDTTDMIEETDGLVMNGYKHPVFDASKAIRKTDLQGNLIWETQLECVWPDTTRANAEQIIPAGDGGYIVLQVEPVYPKEDTDREYRGALVKLDRDGNILWTRTEGFKDFVDRGQLLAMAGGKIAASFTNNSFKAEDNPRRIAWFDENGKFLGNVEMEFGMENFPEMKRLNEKLTSGIKGSMNSYGFRIIPMEDGMWMLGGFCLVQAEKDDTWKLAYDNAGLFRIPEP